jgi:hypothetical protein
MYFILSQKGWIWDPSYSATSFCYINSINAIFRIYEHESLGVSMLAFLKMNLQINLIFLYIL